MQKLCQSICTLHDFAEDNLFSHETFSYPALVPLLSTNQGFHRIIVSKNINNITESIDNSWYDISNPLKYVLKLYVSFKYFNIIYNSPYAGLINTYIENEAVRTASIYGIYLGHFINYKQQFKTTRMSECLPALIYRWNLINKIINSNEKKEEKYGFDYEIESNKDFDIENFFKGKYFLDCKIDIHKNNFEIEQNENNNFSLEQHNTVLKSCICLFNFIDSIYFSNTHEMCSENVYIEIYEKIVMGLTGYRLSLHQKEIQILLQSINAFLFMPLISNSSDKDKLDHLNRFIFKVFYFLENNHVFVGHLFGREQKYNTSSIQDVFNGNYKKEERPIIDILEGLFLFEYNDLMNDETKNYDTYPCLPLNSLTLNRDKETEEMSSKEDEDDENENDDDEDDFHFHNENEMNLLEETENIRHNQIQLLLEEENDEIGLEFNEIIFGNPDILIEDD